MTVNIRGMRDRPFCVTAFALNGAGGIPLGRVLKGDIVENVRNITTSASAAASFETTVTISGEVQQTSAANLSANEYDFIITPIGSAPAF
jgi:hypothetical protein